MDIYSKSAGAAGALSNFTQYFFLFDGVPCACAEGPIQAFKCRNLATQMKICLLSGREAKAYGQNFKEEFQRTQTLWWLGAPYPRESPQYQKLLDRLYLDLSKNCHFREALLSTRNEILTHSIGESDPKKTVLTEEEFCSRLMQTRERLLQEKLERMNAAARMLYIEGIGSIISLAEEFGVETAAILAKAYHARLEDGLESFDELAQSYGREAAMQMIIAHLRANYSNDLYYGPDNFDVWIIKKARRMYLL